MSIITYSYNSLRVSIDIPNLYYLTYSLLLKVSRGKVISYGDLAELLGDKSASRAIGKIMAVNKYPDLIPCFKVVHSDGKVGKYSLGSEEKIRRLVEEGVEVVNGWVDLKKFGVKKGEIEEIPVLKELQLIQRYLASTLRLQEIDLDSIRYVISTDVSYLEFFPDIGIGVAVLIDRFGGFRPIGLSIVLVPIYFPYIPTYLAFRELPPLLMAIESVVKNFGVKPDLIIVDGHGVLHPRSFGIASHLGVVMNIPTIGVAKSKLVGKEEGEISKVGEYNFVKIVHSMPISWGYKVWVKGFDKKSIYISPGNLIDHNSSLQFILNSRWFNGRPLITHLPHRVVSSIGRMLKKFLLSST